MKLTPGVMAKIAVKLIHKKSPTVFNYGPN